MSVQSPACWHGVMPFLFILVSHCAKAEAVDGLFGFSAFQFFSSLSGKSRVRGLPSNDFVGCGAHLTRLVPLLALSISAFHSLTRPEDFR